MAFQYTIFSLVFFLMASNMVFPAEDIHQLIVQGDEALARGDYEQTFSIATKILNANPRHLDGYRFVLVYCVVRGKEGAFYGVLDEAKKQGVPSLVINELAMKVLYVANQIPSIQSKLLDYEKEWLEEYKKSHR